MPFPKNNLPSSSLPWGREIENQIEALKDTVAKNEVNNSARDATNQTNIKNLSSLLTDLSELKTYSASLTYDAGIYETFIGDGTLKVKSINTSALQKTIYITKPRQFLINFSSFYEVSTNFVANSDPYEWGINCAIYVDGIMVDILKTSKQISSTPANGYNNEKGSINMVSVVPVSAGEHVITTYIEYSSKSNGATTFMGLSGDNLVISVIQ